VLKQTFRYRCELVYLQTGVELRSHPSAGHPDPGTPIAMDRRGRFLTASGSQSGTLLEWSAEGTFVREVARLGNGPGEIPSFYIFPLVGRDGTIMARAQGKWMEFSEDLELRREVKTSFPGGSGSTALLDDGRILSSDSRTPPKSRYFHLFDPSTSGIFSFGEGTTPREDSLRLSSNSRPIAYAGGDRFWAAPTYSAGRGYTLELWSTHGHLLRTIRREVNWFPPGADLPGPDVPVPAGTPQRASEEGVQQKLPTAVPRPPSHITAIAVDESGLIYVYLRIVTDRWRYLGDQQVDEEYGRMIPLYIEVIDPDAAEVLVSSGPHYTNPGTDVSQFPRSNLGYSWSEDLNGLSRFKIVKLSLMPKK
jgi:hypothetical protein